MSVPFPVYLVLEWARACRRIRGYVCLATRVVSFSNFAALCLNGRFLLRMAVPIITQPQHLQRCLRLHLSCRNSAEWARSRHSLLFASMTAFENWLQCLTPLRFRTPKGR